MASEALDKIPALDPDVVTLDVEMPGLDGLQTLRYIMTQFPRPVIMVSACHTRKTRTTPLRLSLPEPSITFRNNCRPTSLDIIHIRQDLITKIRAAAQSRPSHSPLALARKPSQSCLSDAPPRCALPTPAIVAIGISTGGPKALQEILPLFLRDLSVPIVIVQHMPLGFTAPFAQRLNTLCSVSVREAAHRDPLRPGVVYIAPAGIHLKVERPSNSHAVLCLDPQPQDALHMPSVDVMMNSVAEVFGNLVLGVIMTGMGSDGAEGMNAIHRRGGFTIGQDESTCTVYGMPRACADLGVLTRIVPLSQIPTLILYATRYRRRA